MLSTSLQIIFLLLLILFFEFFTVQIYNLIFRGCAPFVATKKRVLERILAELKIAPDAKVFELGAGQAGFLRALRRKYEKAELTGVEFSFLPWLIGNIQSAVSNSRIRFEKENLFKTDLGQADLVYCYLNVAMMNKLEEKFAKELGPGAQVVSYQFHLPNKKEEKMVDLGKDGKIYMYMF